MEKSAASQLIYLISAL